MNLQQQKLYLVFRLATLAFLTLLYLQQQKLYLVFRPSGARGEKMKSTIVEIILSLQTMKLGERLTNIYNSRNYTQSLDLEAVTRAKIIYNSRNYTQSLDEKQMNTLKRNLQQQKLYLVFRQQTAKKYQPIYLQQQKLYLVFRQHTAALEESKSTIVEIILSLQTFFHCIL